MQKSAKADINNWLYQHSSLLDVDKSSLVKWYAKYGVHLRAIVENGEAYLSPMLIGDYKDMKIHVVFATDELSPIGNGMPSYFYQEPRTNEETGTLLPPAIIISEKDQ